MSGCSQKVLIANRGEIACRIIRTLHAPGHGSVAVYSEADDASLHVAQADEAVCIGARARRPRAISTSTASSSAAARTGAEAIHPGYGFLSENADFADALRGRRHRLHRADARAACAPSASSTPRARSRRAHGVPLLPGTRPARPTSREAPAAAADRLSR